MADVNTTPITETENPVTTGEGETETETLESLRAIIAKQNITIAENEVQSRKTKSTIDKLTKELGDKTKELKATKTAEQLRTEEEAEKQLEHEEYVKGLETYKRTNEAKNRYLLQGMNTDFATKAAEAEIAGDMEALATIQTQFRVQSVKEAEAEWIKSRPQPQAGTGETSVTKEQLLKMSYKAQLAFKNEHPDLYRKYTE
jgi:hypothetical protein